MKKQLLYHTLQSIFPLFIVLMFTGCGPKTTVILLPDPDGKVGHITVKTDAGSVDIEHALEATVIQGKNKKPSAPTVLSKEEVQTEFATVLNSRPEQPAHFTLYFLKGSRQLTKESNKLLTEILQTIDRQQSQNISVYGHADTAGNDQYNLRLSSERAGAIRETLMSLGIDSKYITSTSHGENNPLVKTPDNTPEPRNRRVEVVIK